MAPQDVASWSAFEATVAEFYRRLGATEVHRNADLGGVQVDLLVEERSATGQRIRTAVECKYYRQSVPSGEVLRFLALVRLLRAQGLVDKATTVAYRGFTRDGLSWARKAGVELLTFQAIEARVATGGHGPVEPIIQEAEETTLPDSFPRLVFALMPFDKTWDDLFLYGIRGPAARCGYQCKRADDVDHDGAIMVEVIDHIKRARLIVAEVSEHNPNVMYEVGWAHALDRPTILVARDGTRLPFDIAHLNTVYYENIKDLDDKLGKRLQTPPERWHR